MRPLFPTPISSSSHARTAGQYRPRNKAMNSGEIRIVRLHRTQGRAETVPTHFRIKTAAQFVIIDEQMTIEPKRCVRLLIVEIWEAAAHFGSDNSFTAVAKPRPTAHHGALVNRPLARAQGSSKMKCAVCAVRLDHLLVHQRLPSQSLGSRFQPSCSSAAAIRRWSAVPILGVSINKASRAT